MLLFVRQHRVLFSGVLLALVLSFMTGCRTYSHRSTDPAKTVGIFQFYMVDEVLPADFAWRIEAEVVRQSGVGGRIVRLNPEEAAKVAKGQPQINKASKNLQVVVFYVNNDYAQSLVKSNAATVDLSFDQVKRTELYEYNVGKSTNSSFLGGLLLTPLVLTVIAAVACSCPYVYADNPGDVLLEGEVFSGSAHSVLERHDWLPLRQLQPNEGVYRVRVVNEDPEVQHINQVELVSVDHPAGMTILYDKYGQLHSIAQPENPVTATDLEGRDVRSVVLKADHDRFNGNARNTDPRAEDGLLLHFRRPTGALQAKLVIGANTSPWLAYSHTQLQNSFGKYGPKIRRRFLEKDSVAVQGWAMRQNIPLSVWLETTPGNWEKVGFFNPIGTNAPRQDVLPIDLSKATGDQIRLKLAYGFHFWEIDWVALDFSPDRPLQPRVLPLSAATDQQGRDLKALLLGDDGQYYVQSKTGDVAVLSFPVPPQTENAERSLMLHAKGYYQIQRETVAGKPSRGYLRQFDKPDAFPKFAREQWNTLLSRDTIWVAHPNR